MAQGPWHPRTLQPSPHQSPQRIPYKKPGLLPLARSLEDWKLALSEWGHIHHPSSSQGMPQVLALPRLRTLRQHLEGTRLG